VGETSQLIIKSMEQKESNYIFGMHPLLEALESNRKIEKVMVRQGAVEGNMFGMLLEKLRQRDIQVQFVPMERLNQITRANHQGVIAFLPQIEYISLEQIVEGANGRESSFILILDGISDVRNFGAIARSAECAGADGIIIPAKGSAAVNSDSVKTSAGALMRIPVCKVTNIREAIYYLKQSGFSIVSASEKATDLIYTADFTKPTAVIVGSEEKGISKSALELSDRLVKVPMVGKISSLNVSVAASVVMFEIVRQRSGEKIL